MSDDKPPKTWWEFASNWTWGTLVFTCGLVFIEKVVEQSYGEALAALILGLGIAAVALHSKEWLERTSPNLVYAAGLVALLVIIFSPFVEGRRWPFSTVFHDPPTAEEIAKAAQPEIDAKTREIDTLRQQLAETKSALSSAQQQISALQVARPPSQAFPTTTLRNSTISGFPIGISGCANTELDNSHMENGIMAIINQCPGTQGNAANDTQQQK